MHGSHHDGWITEEEKQEDHDENILPDFDDLVQNLLTSEEGLEESQSLKEC